MSVAAQLHDAHSKSYIALMAVNAGKIVVVQAGRLRAIAKAQQA